MWQLVRNSWSIIFEKNQDLALANKVENKRLFQYIFALEPTANNDKIITDSVKIKNCLKSFVRLEKQLHSNFFQYSLNLNSTKELSWE